MKLYAVYVKDMAYSAQPAPAAAWRAAPAAAAGAAAARAPSGTAAPAPASAPAAAASGRAPPLYTRQLCIELYRASDVAAGAAAPATDRF